MKKFSVLILPLAVSVIIALLGFILNGINNSNDRLFEMIKTNTIEHSTIKQSVRSEIDWTKTVYNYEIQPNTKRSKRNEERIIVLEDLN